MGDCLFVFDLLSWLCGGSNEPSSTTTKYKRIGKPTSSGPKRKDYTSLSQRAGEKKRKNEQKENHPVCQGRILQSNAIDEDALLSEIENHVPTVIAHLVIDYVGPSSGARLILPWFSAGILKPMLRHDDIVVKTSSLDMFVIHNIRSCPTVEKREEKGRRLTEYVLDRKTGLLMSLANRKKMFAWDVSSLLSFWNEPSRISSHVVSRTSSNGEIFCIFHKETMSLHIIRVGMNPRLLARVNEVVEDNEILDLQVFLACDWDADTGSGVIGIYTSKGFWWFGVRDDMHNEDIRNMCLIEFFDDDPGGPFDVHVSSFGVDAKNWRLVAERKLVPEGVNVFTSDIRLNPAIKSEWRIMDLATETNYYGPMK